MIGQDHTVVSLPRDFQFEIQHQHDMALFVYFQTKSEVRANLIVSYVTSCHVFQRDDLELMMHKQRHRPAWNRLSSATHRVPSARSGQT